MIRGLWTAATGMSAQQLNLDVIAHNLANVNTTGFKKSRAEFQDLIYQTLRAAGTETGGGQQVPTGIQIGMGTKPISVQKMFTQGDYNQTE
ncbi:MAG: flagellar hook-basal body complex protein, partial [Deltaproteobacteria bacterium]|nr:flagellar hook-basal body complex protein [Deltaproteobacteria bacterium]